MPQTCSSKQQFASSDASDLESRVAALEIQLAEIQSRNARVTVEKAWEQSLVRVSWILLLTYLTSTGIFYLLSTEHYLLNALVPTLAFVLSMQSLPFIRTRWLQRHMAVQTKGE